MSSFDYFQKQLEGQPAIIYGRFSSRNQRNSISLERQIESARQFVTENKMNLVPDGVWFDSAMSAFRGKHRKKGQLAALLEVLRSGKLPKQVVLIVENIDRLTRENTLEAIDLLWEIIKTGARIFTLHDRQLYSKERFENDQSAFLLLTVNIQRAHNEARARSERSKASVAKKKKLQEQGIVTKGRKPFWLDSEGKLKEPQASLVRRIIRMYLDEAKGLAAIAKIFNEEGVPTVSGTGIWRQGIIGRLLKNPQLIGYEGANKIYQPVIDQTTFKRITDQKKSRSGGGRPSYEFTSALKGLATCSKCGSGMRTNKAKRPTGNLRTIECRRSSLNGCENKGAISLRLSILFAVWSARLQLAKRHLDEQKQSEVETNQPAIEVIDKEIQQLIQLAKVTGDIEQIGAEIRNLKSRRMQLEEEDLRAAQRSEIDEFAILLTWLHELPDEVDLVLMDDKPACERLRVKLEAIGFKMTLTRDEKLGRMTISDGTHRAYLHGRQDLLIEGKGIIKKSDVGTEELGGGYWYLELPKERKVKSQS